MKIVGCRVPNEKQFLLILIGISCVHLSGDRGTYTYSKDFSENLCL